MNQFKQYLAPVAVALVLIGFSVVLEANWTERFVPRETTAEQLELAKRLESLPKEFGDWVSEPAPMDDTQRTAARIVGDFSRKYWNKNAPDQVVTLMIACGHGIDMKRHTPDQCYIAQGFRATDEEHTYGVDIEPKAADFFTCRFRKDVPGQGPQNIRIFWSFGADGEWVAPSFRGAIVTKPAIYKFYATTFLPNDTRERPDESPAVPFLREFLPLANKVLFPPKEAAAATAEKAVDRSAEPQTSGETPAVEPSAAAK